MSSASPDIMDHHSDNSPEDTGSGPRSMSLSLDLFKSLADRKTTREGNPPKRRGPKPDSKPALTRRQELNRQAQRTHRERKELYIRALEDEVLRLKEIYTVASQDKDKLAEENKLLRELLLQHGIPMTDFAGSDDLGSNSGRGHRLNASPSGNSLGTGSYNNVFSPPSTSKSTAPSVSPPNAPSHPNFSHRLVSGDQMRTMTARAANNSGVDVEQAGIDFVLTLEKPCMDHLPWLLNRPPLDMGPQPCGHALMASCPPEPFTRLRADAPFAFDQQQCELNQPRQTWELSKGDLCVLLDLSQKLDLDGEITPVMAWGILMSHPCFGLLKASDFQKLSEDLVRKVRCYGFGAVMEEFEVRDAIENVLSGHPEAVVY